MNIFETSPTSLGHDEEEDYCVENRQAAKEKVGPAVGIREEDWNDQNDQEVGCLEAHQHLTLIQETLSTNPIGTLSQTCRSCSRDRRLNLAWIRPYTHAPGDAVADDICIYRDDDNPSSYSSTLVYRTGGIQDSVQQQTTGDQAASDHSLRPPWPAICFQSSRNRDRHYNDSRHSRS